MPATATIDSQEQHAKDEGLLKGWLQLVVLQALVAGLVLFPFIEGSLYFAFLDIGSDTYIAAGHAMNLARLFAREGFAGWSFNIGLGAPVAFAWNDIIGQLTQLGGAEHVLELRIWVYMLKIALGGGFFFLFAQGLVRRREPALMAALAYSFCGYIVTNGQWDSETNVFVFAPLVLLGIRRRLYANDRITFPVALGAMLLSGVFFVLVGISLLVAFGLCVAAADDRAATARRWARELAPLSVLGFILGAPYVLPSALQLLDSPRVIGGTAGLPSQFAEAFGVSDSGLLLAQLGGLFHKDIFGIGSLHDSYMNYLESPGFYIGMPFLLLAGQLWNRGPANRRWLLVGLVAVGLYFLFPFIRMAAFGLAAPYFRGTTLWVAIGLLVLGMRGLDVALERGIDLEALWMSAAIVGGLLGVVALLAPVSPTHAWKMAGFLFVAAALLAAVGFARLNAHRLPSLLLGLLLVELVTTAWPSYYVLRAHAKPQVQPYNDVTLPALAAIRADRPPAFYRVEKTFDSFEADALAQDYMGVKSYYYHGRSVVRFHEGMDFMTYFRKKRVNATNWLPGPGDRFLLHSALGVRYIVSKAPLAWPALVRIAEGDGYVVYRNSLALPLGVVHTRQVLAADLGRTGAGPVEQARATKDLVLMNAAVVDSPMPQWGTRANIDDFARLAQRATPADYSAAAEVLQRTGLNVKSFSNTRITGAVDAAEKGLLVFSIPASDGWSVRVDGRTVETVEANFGMLATPIAAGPHEVELRYSLPGLVPGLLLGAGAAIALLIMSLSLRRRDRRAAPVHAVHAAA